MPEATGQGKEGHLCYSALLPNLQEPSKDLKSVTDRAAQTLLWTELLRSLGRVLSNLLRETTAPPSYTHTRERPTGSRCPWGNMHQAAVHLFIHPSTGRGEAHCTAGQLYRLPAPNRPSPVRSSCLTATHFTCHPTWQGPRHPQDHPL